MSSSLTTKGVMLRGARMMVSRRVGSTKAIAHPLGLCWMETRMPLMPSLLTHLCSTVAPRICHLPIPPLHFADSKAEKPARAALFTAATRHLRSDAITIIDSANYIKGYRYQLYCAAREAGVRVATIRTAVPPAQCAEWHAARPENERYAQATCVSLPPFCYLSRLTCIASTT